MRNVALGKLIVCAAIATVRHDDTCIGSTITAHVSTTDRTDSRASPRGQPDDDGWDGGIRRPVEDHRGENRGRACTAQ